MRGDYRDWRTGYDFVQGGVSGSAHRCIPQFALLRIVTSGGKHFLRFRENELSFFDPFL